MHNNSGMNIHATLTQMATKKVSCRTDPCHFDVTQYPASANEESTSKTLQTFLMNPEHDLTYIINLIIIKNA
jgi:hypothetical protein